jgi:homoserine kinase
VAGILLNDGEMLGRALGEELVVEAARGPLIPGFAAVKQAAMKAGAHGCTISGAGPTIVAIVTDRELGDAVADAMCSAFRGTGQLEINTVQVVELDRTGARPSRKA